MGRNLFVLSRARILDLLPLVFRETRENPRPSNGKSSDGLLRLLLLRPLAHTLFGISVTSVFSIVVRYSSPPV